MKRIQSISHFLLLLVLLGFVSSVYTQQLAFPTAEGYGKFTVGGRGGKVYEVTTLDPTGSGSLGEAISASGARTIVFRVSGTIEGSFSIQNDSITIAGQTAPGDGICIKGSLSINASEVIIRYLRIRANPSLGEVDAIGGRYNKNIIIDHVSASWSSDEVFSLYKNEYVTVQWCMITEACAKFVNGENTGHRFGGIWGNNYGTYHHNLIAHNDSRNPRWSSGARYNDFRNNVTYNWGYNSCYGGGAVDANIPEANFSTFNIVANYYKAGPATDNDIRRRIAAPSNDGGVGSWYVADNYVNGFSNVTKDNWLGIDGTSYTKLDEPWGAMPIDQQMAEAAYLKVLAQVGCSKPARDSIDLRIIEEVRTGTATYGNNGIITYPSDVGGWPLLKGGSSPDDTDHDGMPDVWEIEQGLNHDNPLDRNTIGLDGFTMLEKYINSLVEYPYFLAHPIEVKSELYEIDKVRLSWKDIEQNETGFVVERATGDTGSFQMIATVDENVIFLEDSLLEELTLYRYRVQAIKDTLFSGFGNVSSISTLGVTSLPVPISYISPQHGISRLNPDTMLLWTSSFNASSYDVYLGQDNPPVYLTNQTDTVYLTGMLELGETYYWRIDARNANGVTEGIVRRFATKPAPVGIHSTSSETGLVYNYPNPFTSSTNFYYELKNSGRVKLSIYSSVGQEVDVLVDHVQAQGSYTILFNAGGLKDGVYYYVLKTESGAFRGKMIYIRQ